MKLDNAAAAFRLTDQSFEVLPNDDGTFRVRDAIGMVLQADMSKDDATALRDQEAGRAAVTAVLRETISTDILMEALGRAALDLRKIGNNRVNMGRRPVLALLQGIITALEADALRDPTKEATSEELIALLEDPKVRNSVNPEGRHGKN